MSASLEVLTERLIAALTDWDKACTLLVDRCKRERYRPGAQDLGTQTRALGEAERSVAARLGVTVRVLRARVQVHRHRGATPGYEWAGRPAVRVHVHGTTGRDAGDAVQDAVNDLTAPVEVPTPQEHRRAS